MPYQVTTATKKISKLKKRIRAVAGGTSASKSISILLNLIHLSQTDKSPKLTSVVSESFPHLKKGVRRDFLDIMQEHNYFKESRWNKSYSIYTFETGSEIEFFSADQPDKVRGPRRDRLFINEANNVHYEAFDQLEVRTNDLIFLDWNPTSEFWFYDKVVKRDDVDFITLTYKDNEALNENIIRSIEQRKNNKQWWRVYGEGKLGEAEGRIYTGWKIIKEIPHEAKLMRYGLDFGFSNDPTVLVAVYKYNQGYIIDEILHKKGMVNREIADTIKNIERALVVADSSEPKSIEEIKRYGVNIISAGKGQGSRRQGISFVQDQKISVTQRSLNVIKSYRNYMWLIDQDGKETNTPNHLYSDAMDAVRYGINSMGAAMAQGLRVVRF